MPRPIDDFVQQIYSAAADPAAWEPMLREIASEIGAIAPGIILRTPAPDDPGRRLTFDTDPAFNATWDDYFVRFERELNVFAGLPPGRVTTCARMIPESVYLASEMYNEWMRPQQRRHWIVALAWREGLSAGGPAFQREEGLPDFDANDLAFLERLLPHFQQALRLYWRLEQAEGARRAHRELLDAFPIGVILCDARGAVVEANRAAELILGAEDGLAAAHGQLVASLPRETRALRRLVAGAAAAGAGNAAPAGGAAAPGGVLALPRPSRQRPFHVLVTPLGRDAAAVFHHRRPAAAVFVSDPERLPELPESRVQRLLGLTPAEARVAVEVARGLSSAEIADRAGVHPNTIRWHLKQIYAKTGVRRQAELVRFLAFGPIPLAAEPEEQTSGHGAPGTPGSLSHGVHAIEEGADDRDATG